MLSAFTAQSIVELKQRDKSKIESILAYGDKLLVGLNTGSLRIYRVNEIQDPEGLSGENGATTSNNDEANGESEETPKTKAKPVDLLREEEKFSRRPVQQLAIIKEVGILVSLSDGYVSIHELQTYALQERLDRTKGATAFAITSNIVKDLATGIPDIVSSLAVAVKRRIMIWSWQAMELNEAVTEITLVSSIKSLNWATATKLVVGMDPGFVTVNVKTQEIEDIVKPGVPGEAGGQAGVKFGAVNSSGMGYMGMGGWVPKPMATKLGEGEMLLAKDVNTLFVDVEGKALEKRQVPWAQAPEAIGYSYPYMLALQPPAKGGLEVRSPDTLSLLQTVSLPNAALLHVPQPNISLAHAGKGFLVASDRVVWRMGALDYESQIDVLTNQGRYDEAVSLLGMLEDTLLKDKDGRLREVKILKAQSLFIARRYRDSLDHFSEAAAPPARVIALYPKAIAGELSTVEEPEPESQEEEEEQSENGKSAPSSPKIQPQGTVSRSMFGRLMAEQKKVAPDAASVRSGKVGEASDTGSLRGKPADAKPVDRPLEGRDLTIAVNELCAFLAQTRVQLQKFLNYDGSLKQDLPAKEERSKDYRPPFSKYIVLPEHIEEADWRGLLFEVATLVDTTLFRAYMLARPGLAGSLFRLDNFCDPLVVRDKLYESGRYGDLIDFLYGKKLHREALQILAKFGRNEEAKEDGEVAPNLRGPQRTIGYLQQLPPELVDIILEFAEWPLKIEPKEGMQIFLADTENAETLPRHRVLDFVQKIGTDLAVEYLEHIIFELNDLGPDFHQRLIDLYLDHLQSAETPESDKDRSDWRSRLEKMLKTSSQYNRARVFKRLPQNDSVFYESRAIVLSKMGNHKQALQIYVFQIQDPGKAEEYCNEQFLLAHKAALPPSRTVSPTTLTRRRSEQAEILTPSTDATDDAEPSIYHTLLSLYLQPPSPHKPSWAPALDLLSKHGSRLPASSTLSLLDPSLPVKNLESYFRTRVRAATSAMREERIVARLRGVEKVASEEVLLGLRGRSVNVDEERVCGICFKRFGGSAIRVWPDGKVTHYGCAAAAAAGPGSARMKSGEGRRKLFG